jgi:hypothetical protein
MTDIKARIYQHFYTRKKNFILGKPVLTIFQDKDRFDIRGEYEDKQIRFKLDHGVAHIYFTDIDNLVEFIEKHKETK